MRAATQEDRLFSPEFCTSFSDRSSLLETPSLRAQYSRPFVFFEERYRLGCFVAQDRIPSKFHGAKRMYTIERERRSWPPGWRDRKMTANISLECFAARCPGDKRHPRVRPANGIHDFQTICEFAIVRSFLFPTVSPSRILFAARSPLLPFYSLFGGREKSGTPRTRTYARCIQDGTRPR